MSKIDFKRELKEFYRPSGRKFSIVDVPPMQFLMVNGRGDPNTAQEYKEAVEALYAAAYTLKFMSKLELGRDYVVPPLEGLWWADDMDNFTVRTDKSRWIWTMMIMQPEWMTEGMLETAVARATKKKGQLPAFTKLRIQTYHEGTAAQILYTGPYADEGPTITRLHAFIAENGYQLSGKHHEIYLGDPRRTAPEKLKTVIRQPFS